MADPSKPGDPDDGHGLRSTFVALVCASFSIFYVIVVLGCSTFCVSKGHDCGGDGRIFYVPFLLFPFALMTSVIFVLTLCSRLRTSFQIKVALALIALFLCPSLLAIVVRHEMFLTTVVFLGPVSAALLGAAVYFSYALVRRAA